MITYNDLAIASGKAAGKSNPDSVMKAYAELYNDHDAVMWLYHDRCVVCGQKAEEINEIVPRARTKDWNNWRNQVTLCHSCHVEYHRNGVTDDKMIQMRQLREEFLRRIGREQFI